MKKMLFVLAALLTVSVLFAGGRREGRNSAPESDRFAWIESTESGFPYVNPLLVQGDVSTAGSSTVSPLAAVVVERYKEDGFQGQITIDVIGSGAGFERFTVAGEIDITNASRVIRNSEVENANNIGRRPISFRVGTDALSVVVSKDNTFIDDVSAEELGLIFGSAERWSDVNPSWPSQPIQRYIPGTDSGTFDFFVELLYHADPTEILSAANTQQSEDDNVLVRGITGSPYAVGFFGYAYYIENQELLNILSVEGINPSLATVETATADSIAGNVALGSYPIARPLLIYSDAEIMRSRPQVAAYLAYFINNVNDVIDEVGYFPTDLSPAKQQWLDAMEGAF